MRPLLHCGLRVVYSLQGYLASHNQLGPGFLSFIFLECHAVNPVSQSTLDVVVQCQKVYIDSLCPRQSSVTFKLVKQILVIILLKDGTLDSKTFDIPLTGKLMMIKR